MNLQEDLQQLENQVIQIWDYLTGKPSLPSQLERLYLKPLVYLVSFFLNARAALAASAKPGKIAGSLEAYKERVLQISPDIADAGLTNPLGNNIVIHILGKSGPPSSALINLVLNTMQSDANKIMCDTITVQAAVAQPYQITAGLILSLTANETATLAEANATIEAYIAERKNTLGGDIVRTDIINLLRDNKNIRDVNLTVPATNIAVPPQSYGVGTATLTFAGRSV